jgi:hypothetical protein
MTVEEVLRQSGFSDEQIRALDSKTITAFGGVLSAAERERQEAAAARDANARFYDESIVPSLVGWEEERSKIESEKARLASEAAYYRSQNEAARASGFIPNDVPGFGQQRDGQGRYVANAPGGTPGSPQYFDVNRVYERAGDAVNVLTDIQWEHQRLFGQPLPISPSELVKKADALKVDPRTYAARTFNWDQRRAEMTKAEKDAERAAIVKETETRVTRELSEKFGSNPDVRRPMASQYADVNRAIKANTIPDPLTLNDQQRRALTSQMIRRDISDQAGT